MMVVASTATTQAADIFDVKLSYCDTPESTKYIQMSSASVYPLCYTLTNTSDVPLEVYVDFVDGTNTYDQFHHKACLDAHHKEMFGRFVTWYTSNIRLKAGESKQQQAEIQYPKEMQGVYQWCIIYMVSTNGESITTPEGINIVLRKAKFIEVKLDGVASWLSTTSLTSLRVSNEKRIVLAIVIYGIISAGIVSVRYARRKVPHTSRYNRS